MTFRKFFLGHYRAAICKWDWQCPFYVFYTVLAAQKVEKRVEDMWMVFYLLVFIWNWPGRSWVNECKRHQLVCKGVKTEEQGYFTFSFSIICHNLSLFEKRMFYWSLLWNGSKALQISRNGLNCYTDGLMVY